MHQELRLIHTLLTWTQMITSGPKISRCRPGRRPSRYGATRAVAFIFFHGSYLVFPYRLHCALAVQYFQVFFYIVMIIRIGVIAALFCCIWFLRCLLCLYRYYNFYISRLVWSQCAWKPYVTTCGFVLKNIFCFVLVALRLLHRRGLVKEFVLKSIAHDTNLRGWASITGFSSFMSSYWHIFNVNDARAMTRIPGNSSWYCV